MFLPGGHIYVYLCYGIHHLLNIVTGEKNQPTAVLIRAIEPLEGISKMEQRRSQKRSKTFTVGPGKVSQALGIKTAHNGLTLKQGGIWIEDHRDSEKMLKIKCGKRIGIDYAEEDADLPYRFWIHDANL